MEFSFSNLPEESSIWIYQSNRDFTSEEEQTLSKSLSAFVSNWKSHGSDVSAGYDILFKRFIIFASHENSEVSGCSVDKSVHFIKNLENELNIKLLDRTFVIYKEGTKINQASIAKIKEMISRKMLSPDTVIFNNSITLLKDLKSKWEIKVSESWLSKYIPI